MWESISSEAGPKALAYVALLAFTGAATATALAPRGPAGATLRVVCARVARIAAFVAVAALALRGWAHASAVADGALDRVTLARVILESRWGGRWQWQLAAAVAALALALTRALVRGAWPGPAVVAVLWCVATPLLGHGASTPWQHASHALHLLVAGAWLGTVGVLAIAAGPRSGVPAEALTAVVGRFSPVAMGCAALVALSGTLLAVTYVGTIADLVQSPYGRWLLAKLAVIGAVGACGAANWRRARHRRATTPTLLRLEAVFAVLAAAITAVLGETEHPSL
jgi:copper transport protein